MQRRFLFGLACCLSCQLLLRPDPNLFLEDNPINCFDGVDNDENELIDCADPSCARSCQDDTLQIAGLTPNNCTSTQHDSLTGDDRGGIAVGIEHVLYSGDTQTAGFTIDALASSGYTRIYDGLFSDLRSGKVFTFLKGDLPMDALEGDLTGFQEIDTQSGDLIGSPVLLSQPIFVTDGTGIFSGKSRVVLHSLDRAFDINVGSGVVTDLGAVPTPSHQECESWAYWGVAEFFNDQLFMTYVSGSSTISRTSLTGAPLTEEVARFATLSDMCSFTVAPLLNRWYFHSEGLSSVSAAFENIGYCDALFGEQPITGCGDGIRQDPEECDDANAIDKDGCTNCVQDRCGDGVVNNNILDGSSLEACDDANNADGDNCRGDCLGIEVCGDGLLDVGEECDDNNTDDNDGCEGTCNFVCANARAPLMAFFDGVSGRCYALLDNPTFWQDAEQTCVDAGGHLATIDSQAANDLVFPAANSFAPWIGLNDLTTEGTFGWISGSPVVFTGFAPGEPGNINGDEDCVSYTGEGWFALPCADSHKPLCELP